MVGASAQNVDVSSFVKATSSQCLSLYPNVITVKDNPYENGITGRSIANATIDFRGVTVRGQAKVGKIVAFALAPLLAIAVPPVVNAVNSVLDTDFSDQQISNIAIATIVGIALVVWQWLRNRGNWERAIAELYALYESGRESHPVVPPPPPVSAPGAVAAPYDQDDDDEPTSSALGMSKPPPH